MGAGNDRSLGEIGGCSGGTRDPQDIPDIIRAVSGAGAVRFDGFVLDEGRRLLTRDGTPIHLTRKAFDFLVMLVAHTPRVVTKDTLHQQLWQNTFVTDATVASVVKELRAAFRAHGCSDPLIRTVHGVGYAFAGTLERIAGDGTVAADPRWFLIAGSRHVMLKEGANDIGRDPDATIWLDSPQVSRRHARVVVAGHTATVEDLGSKNATLVNERAISVPTPLCDGDAIQIGSTVLVCRVMDPTASTESAHHSR